MIRRTPVPPGGVSFQVVGRDIHKNGGRRRPRSSTLMAHDYPGNIRELENIIEHAFVLCSKDTIAPEHLPGSLVAQVPLLNHKDRMKMAVRTLEAQTIITALKNNRCNRLAAARELGIHKSTLFRKIKRSGLDLPKQVNGSHHCDIS